MLRTCFHSQPNAAARHLAIRPWLALTLLALQVTAALPAQELFAVSESLLQRSRQLEQARAEAVRRPLRQAEVRCGPWHCIGPFKDAEYGVFSREFDTAFEPEKDVVAGGDRLAALDQPYHSVPVVGAPESARRWVAHPDWADGYYNQLPSGPPPGRNEVLYLYRTITCAAPLEVTAWLVTLDAGKAWLNGRQILDAPIRAGAGQRFLQSSFKIPLKAGENRLLVKITKCFQKNGFSFAIEGLHPIHPALKGQAPARDAAGFNPAPEPYASAIWQQPRSGHEADPACYVRKDTWQASFLASRQAVAAGKPSGLPYTSRVLRQRDGPQHVRLNVSGRRQLVLVCTTGGDNYDYDDTIWADPKLVAKDGKETWLTDLKPAEAKVGFMELFVNRNHAGQGLKIGTRDFERGFWAHAPSVLVFDLAGKYEWFETWFGLDVLANQPGSSAFVIGDSVESASPPDLDASLRALLSRDFPGRQPHQEMERELADGIWDGIVSAGQTSTLCDRYAAAILRTLALPAESADVLPRARNAEALPVWRDLYHQVKLGKESLTRLHRFRFEVEPLPTYDSRALAMQPALDSRAPTPGGAAYLARLAPVRDQARAALQAYATGGPGAAQALIGAAEALQRFQDESIRALGPIVFARHPSFGRINAVDPYDTDGRGPASLAVFDPAFPARPPTVIYRDPKGAVWQASLSYDAQTLFFSARRHGVSGGWHIYAIGVDGRNLAQITDGDGNDIAPVELPSGQILFVSNRAGNMNVCQANRAGALYVCERDGKGVRRVSANTLSDHTPAVMDDGRVMFTRWDYGVDKGVFQRHGVWTMAPDGSRLRLFFGNTVLDPNAFWQCVPVPGRPEVISTFGGHHAGPYGVVGLLWNGLGVEAPRGDGYRFLTPEYPTYFDGAFQTGYMDPHPLNEHEYLVSYGGEGGQKSRIYLLDSRGNQTCVWEEAGDLGCYNPLALRPRTRPPVIPMSPPPEFKYVDPVEANARPDDSIPGTFLLYDVYEGLQGQVRRGEIKSLQIMELVPKTRPHIGGYAWNISPLIGRGTFYVRRLIGTVPVEADGSAHFTAPALRDISLNALDADGRVVQKMGSTTQIIPGERQSCIGCHVYDQAAPSQTAHTPQATRHPPSSPQRPDWGTDGIIDYVRVVQPVWDRHCAKCHSGPRPDGNLDLSGDKTRYFNMSYDMLIDRDLVHHLPQNGADQDLTTPKANGSLASRLIRGKYLEPDHYRVALSPADRQRVYTWIDANVPYYHTYLYTDGSVNGARCRWYDDQPNGWFQKEFAPVFLRRCFDCHKRTVDISDAWLGRCTVTVTSKVWNDITLMSQGLQIENSVATFGPEYRINLTHPEWSQMLTAPLSKSAGGLGFCKTSQDEPIFASTNDADYQTVLQALRRGAELLQAHPRVDMLPTKSLGGGTK